MKHNRQWLVVCILLIVCMILPACDRQEPGHTTIPTEPTAAPTTALTEPATEPPTAPPTEPATEPPAESATVPTEPEPIYPEGATPLTQEELDYFTELVTWDFAVVDGYRAETNWYNMALCCPFESPEELDFARFFCMDIGGKEALTYPLTEEELEYLNAQPQMHVGVGDVYRVSGVSMDAVIWEYLGVGLADMDLYNMSQGAYFLDTNCFYFHPPGVLCADNPRVIDGYRTAEGDIVIYCNHGGGQLIYECLMGLRPKEDGYLILFSRELGMRSE